MKNIRTVLVLLICCSISRVCAQDALTLEQSIELALKNNYDIKNSELEIKAAQQTKKSALTKVEEARPVAADRVGRRVQAEHGGHVHEAALAAIQVQQLLLVIEARHQQVQLAVAVDVLGVCGHRPHGLSVGTEGHAGLEGDVAETSLPQVLEQQVR